MRFIKNGDDMPIGTVFTHTPDMSTTLFIKISEIHCLELVLKDGKYVLEEEAMDWRTGDDCFIVEIEEDESIARFKALAL